MIWIRVLLLAVMVPLGVSAQTAFSARIAEIEQGMERYFRGPRIEEARDRSNKDIEGFNARIKALNAELAEARTRLERLQAPAQVAYANLQKLDAHLKVSIPDGADGEGNKQYQARVAERNILALKLKELNALGERALEEHNAFAITSKADLDRHRVRVLADQEAVNLRAEAFEKLTKSGEDIDFFTRVNRLLAEIRLALRQGEQPGLVAALDKVRAFRRELGIWAMGGQSLNPKGLVVIEVRVADEPCWLIVDSGATETILNQEVADALGLASVGKEAVHMVVVGGLRLQGRHLILPSLQVAGNTRTDVSASTVRPSDVGIDGLLGQSFLKSFVYTIDERRPEKLILSPK